MLRVGALLALVGCLEPDAVTCPDGSACPGGTVCATATTTLGPRTYCVDASQLGCSANESCDAHGRAGSCHDGVCLPIACSNLLIDPGEACDDGNNDAGDGCSADCKSAELCGNAVVDAIEGEQCDEGIAGLSHDGCSSLCGPEVLAWHDITPSAIEARTEAAMVYDGPRNLFVLFGGQSTGGYLADTWERDTMRWFRRETATAPAPRRSHAMAYDPARERVVLFGGNGGTIFGDTWLWDGVTWSEAHPSTSPPPRSDAAITYDTDRGVVLLFGGTGEAGPLDDTWEWDGTTWSERMPGVRPPTMGGPVMAYDPGRHRAVVYGNMGTQTQTWEWDGSTWSLPSPATLVGNRDMSAMVFDEVSAMCVMNGREGTWAWTGSDWQNINTTQPRYSGNVLGYTPQDQRIELFGGLDVSTSTLHNETWYLVSSTWSVATAPALSPGPRAALAMAHASLRGTTIIYGGVIGAATLTETWVFDQTGWTQATSGLHPRALAHPALAYDAARDRVVLFGGGDTDTSPAITSDETWEFDGRRWTQSTPAIKPASRRLAAFAFDERANKLVLFGGGSGNLLGTLYGDTWTWDGTSWTQLFPATSPPAREGAGFAYDAVRGRLVIYGGLSASGTNFDDVWEWDGTTWLQAPAVTPSPGARYRPVMVYDPHRQRIVMSWGFVAGSPASDSWAWDGATWTELALASSAGNRSAAVYDNFQHQIMTFAGSGFSLAAADTWALRYESPLEPRELCIVATADDDGDGRAGCLDPDCWTRCTPRCPPGAPCDPSTPHCGDGTCGIIEDSSICPQDCP